MRRSLFPTCLLYRAPHSPWPVLILKPWYKFYQTPSIACSDVFVDPWYKWGFGTHKSCNWQSLYIMLNWLLYVKDWLHAWYCCLYGIKSEECVLHWTRTSVILITFWFTMFYNWYYHCWFNELRHSLPCHA
jgi:hypothetical protein